MGCSVPDGQPLFYPSGAPDDESRWQMQTRRCAPPSACKADRPGRAWGLASNAPSAPRVRRRPPALTCETTPPGSSFKCLFSGKQRRRPGRSGFQRGAAKCRRPTGGSPADGGVERSWRWAHPPGVNPAGEASTLPETGDKVLARHARRSARPATPVAGVLEGHGGAQNKAAATAPAYSPKKKTRKMRSCILVLCLLFTLIIRRTIWPLQNGSFGRSRPDNLSALKKPFASMHFALLQATEPLCGEELVSCGVIFSGTARVRSSVRNDLMDRVST